MLKDNLLKNIFDIKPYLVLNNLDDNEKRARREYAQKIVEILKDTLYELYFDGFLLGSLENLFYKENLLRINFKRPNYDVFLSLEIDTKKLSLDSVIKVQNEYLIYDDVSLKITKQSLNNSEFNIEEFSYFYIIFDKKSINIKQDNFESSFKNNIKTQTETIYLLDNKYKDFYNKIEKNDVFLFDKEGNLNVSWEDFESYDPSSTNIKMATEKLLNFYFESDGNKKNEIMLALAHLNLKVGYQFFHTIRLSETSNKEKEEWVEVILKRVISTIKNHQMDGGASLSTRLRRNMLAGLQRGRHLIVRDRISQFSKSVPTFEEIVKFEVNYKLNHDAYPSLKEIFDFGLKIAIAKQEKYDLKENLQLQKNKSLSSVSMLANELNVSINFEKEEIKNFVDYVKLIGNKILDERERKILKEKYKLDEINMNNLIRPTELRSLASKYNISHEMVRLIIKSALDRIRVVIQNFPDSTLDMECLNPIPETVKKKGQFKINKIGRTFLEHDYVVIGQLKEEGILDGNMQDFAKHKVFKDLNKTSVNKYIANNFPELCDTESIEFLHITDRLSIRSFNALSKNGIKKINEIDVEDLENFQNLGNKSVEEIKKLVMEFKDI